jgi:small-conductance mechanosensitive channel
MTSQDVAAWLRAAKERRAHLHLLAALSPWQSDQRQEAFTALSALLQEAFEEVRVVSESTREWSQNVRGTSTDLQTHATQLRARSAAVLDRMAQFAPPPPEELRKAESEMLALFKGGTGPRTSSAHTPEPSLHAEEDRWKP